MYNAVQLGNGIATVYNLVNLLKVLVELCGMAGYYSIHALSCALTVKCCAVECIHAITSNIAINWRSHKTGDKVLPCREI